MADGQVTFGATRDDLLEGVNRAKESIDGIGECADKAGEAFKRLAEKPSSAR
jgi:hypothetical protein